MHFSPHSCLSFDYILIFLPSPLGSRSACLCDPGRWVALGGLVGRQRRGCFLPRGCRAPARRARWLSNPLPSLGLFGARAVRCLKSALAFLVWLCLWVGSLCSLSLFSVPWFFFGLLAPARAHSSGRAWGKECGCGKLVGNRQTIGAQRSLSREAALCSGMASDCLRRY